MFHSCEQSCLEKGFQFRPSEFCVGSEIRGWGSWPLFGEEQAEQCRMKWWSKTTSTLRRFTFRVAPCLGFRNRGLIKLGRDVKACEYEDVNVMWEMLKRNETELLDISEKPRKRRSFWNIFGWARSAQCIGRRY